MNTIVFIMTYRVSIPHRHAKNKEYFYECSGGNVEFQFLIGTLKTSFLVACLLSKSVFQFLIGTLKTAFPLNHFLYLLQFQFLIGTLKTNIAELSSFIFN